MAAGMMVGWTAAESDAMERAVFKARHRLHESPLFSDEGLCRIIDEQPPKDLWIHTMGRDSSRAEWRRGDRGGVSSQDLLRAVRTGHLWINVLRVGQHHAALREMIEGTYAELAALCPGFTPFNLSGNLLLSSPGAIVNYHADIPLNILWHLRGRKRVWVYPAGDFRFVSQEDLENIYAGDIEDVTYRREFDEAALVFDLEPGEMATWPQNAPHRIENLNEFCVSLSTEHYTPEANLRQAVHLANRFFRRRLGLPCRSTSVAGPSAFLKANSFRVIRRLALKRPKGYTLPITFRVDPTSPTGYVDLDGAAPEAKAA